MLKKLEKKILSKKAHIGVIGLGYVGLPLALTFARNGFKVKGIDIDKVRIVKLGKGQSHILDTSPQEIKDAMKSGKEEKK